MKITLLILLSTVLVYQEYSLYNKALKQGEINYKASKRIYKAFESAYHFGYQDCSDGKPENWDGE